MTDRVNHRSKLPVAGFSRRFIAVSAALAGLTLWSPLPAAPAWGQDPAAAQATASAAAPDLGTELWSDALHRDVSGVFTLLDALDDSGRGDAGRSASDLLEDLEVQAQQRRATYEESMAKLQADLDAGKLGDAVVAAIAAHDASLEPRELLALHPETGLRLKEDVLNDPLVLDAIDRALAAAKQAEAEGDWMGAQDLFYRLNELQDRRYDADLERVTKRLALLRFYAPKRLDALVNAHLVKIGEEPRPGYDEDTPSWQKNVEPLTRDMVEDALRIAALNHLSQPGYAPLLAGGFEALETLATTTDLKEVFPGMASELARDRFLRHVRDEKAYWSTQARADRVRVRRALDRLEEVNRETVSLPPEVIYHEFGDGFITKLDPFSDLIWPYEIPMFMRQLQGTFSGVGIQIITDEANQLKVVTPLPHSPAHRAGIQADDLITAVNGKSTLGITIPQAIEQITGPEGTEVTLTIKRADEPEPLDFTLARKSIPIESVKGWRKVSDTEWDYFIRGREEGVGYIRLTGFLEQTVDDFDDAIEAMGDDLKALVIDVRFNPGGQLQAVIDLCNRFVSQGVVVATEGPNQRPKVHKAVGLRASKRLAEVPVVVLVNEGSASASEILAGCLRDHERAVVVGTRTFGKGSVQKIHDDVDGAEALLRLTGEHYLLPDGDMIHREAQSTQWGVEPHLVVRMTPKQMGEMIEVLRDLEILPDASHPWTAEQTARRDPDRLLEEGLDTQLQAAMVLLEAHLAASDDEAVEHALLNEQGPNQP